MESYRCITCGNPLKGRADKRFCDYLCKNEFHNKTKRRTVGNTYLDHVNHNLKRNYSILSGVMETSQRYIARGDLKALGFDFNHYTRTEQSELGEPCYFCYDVGYIPDESGYFALVSLNEEPAGRNR